MSHHDILRELSRVMPQDFELLSLDFTGETDAIGWFRPPLWYCCLDLLHINEMLFQGLDIL